MNEPIVARPDRHDLAKEIVRQQRRMDRLDRPAWYDRLWSWAKAFWGPQTCELCEQRVQAGSHWCPRHGAQNA
jgi:hypothetical protein